MKHAIAIVLALMVLSPFAVADDLRHPPARKAVARAEQETRKAEQVYRQAMIRIQRDLIRELEQAKADAMQRQLLEDANAIQQAIDAAQAELDRLEGKPVVERFTIEAATPRTPTVEVRSGDKVTIQARGQWSHDSSTDQMYGPDGAGRRGSDLGTLQGQIGDGPRFLIGRQASFVADTDGTLYLFMRDSVPADNRGAVQVTISKQSR